MNTASAEQSTPKIPFKAQYHGVSPILINLTSRIPTGKHRPNSIPRGQISNTDTNIFMIMGDVIKFEVISGTRNRIRIMPNATANGYM